MWLEWLPWRYAVRVAARAKGFVDPIALLSHVQRFAQPAEVAVPVELLRLGFVLQARGLMNAQAIQHNMDWIWPFWADRQFNPRDPAFIPRAFSATQINLTHRNWTALGLPGFAEYPLVDPRGLVTPFYDSWSLDFWIVDGSHELLIPSREEGVIQDLSFDAGLTVKTTAFRGDLALDVRSRVELSAEGKPVLRLRAEASSGSAAWLAVSLRPYNPEGVSFIHDAELLRGPSGWRVNKKQNVYFDQPCDRHRFSHYKEGDVARKLPEQDGLQSVQCHVGMATAAALFALEPGQKRAVLVHVPLEEKDIAVNFEDRGAATAALWEDSLKDASKLGVPDGRFRFLYEAALRTLVLHSPDEIYPGPFTYKHFWFRDAALISYALLCAGLTARVENLLDKFFERQTFTGYFHSQDGEWDSNGQVLWILQKFCEMTGKPPKKEWKNAILKGGRWIEKKRVIGKPEELHAGLLPAGFSAEHFGPSDYYFWDDFWGIQGLLSAAWLADRLGHRAAAEEFNADAQNFRAALDYTLRTIARRQGHEAVPASPYRRMDAAAVGSLVGGYPLRLWAADDPRLLATANFLHRCCFVNGAFFHDIAHSGINPYLTLHIAQVLLRAGDPRYFDMTENMAMIATRTGQWPEAIHPQTQGGCMGDGQHVWAAAEWVMMMRNFLVREEEGRLIVGSGIPSFWLKPGAEFRWGPAPTEFGMFSVEMQCTDQGTEVRWEGLWHADIEPEIEVRIAGHEAQYPEKNENRVLVEKTGGAL